MSRTEEVYWSARAQAAGAGFQARAEADTLRAFLTIRMLRTYAEWGWIAVAMWVSVLLIAPGGALWLSAAILGISALCAVGGFAVFAGVIAVGVAGIGVLLQ